MRFQMRQGVSYAVICGKGCSPSFEGGMAFLIILRKIAQNRPRVQDFCGKTDGFTMKFGDDRLDSLIWLYYHLNS